MARTWLTRFLTISDRHTLLPLVIALVAAALYLPSVVGGEFLNYDDGYLIQNNRVIARAEVGKILDPTAHREDLGSEYLPVRDLTWVVDSALFGDGSAPQPVSVAFGARLLNLGYYALACWLAGTFLLAALGADRRAPAILAAALFALHPAHAESVAWISGRKDLLAGAFVFACLLAHLRAREGERVPWYLASAALAALACLSKSTSTALPFLILATECLPTLDRAPWKRRLLRALPVFFVCAAAAVLAMWVGSRTGVGKSLDPFALVERLPEVFLRDAVILRHYVVVAFVPFDLRIGHRELLAATDWEGGLVVNALVSLLALAPLAVVALRSKGLGRFALIWFVGGLLPVLNLIPFSQWIADRFLFLPVLAACLLIAWLLCRIGRDRPQVAWALLAVVALTWSARAVLRGLDFKTSRALWEAQLRVDPGDPLASKHLGQLAARAAHGTSSPRVAARHIEEAQAHLERAVQAFEVARPAAPGHHLEAQMLLAQILYERRGAWRSAVVAWLRAAELLDRPGATISLRDWVTKASYTRTLLAAARDDLLRHGGPEGEAELLEQVEERIADLDRRLRG